MFWGRVTEVSLSIITLTVVLILYKLFNATAGPTTLGKQLWQCNCNRHRRSGPGGINWRFATVIAKPRRAFAKSPSVGAARQTAFMCTRAQSEKFVNPPGTRALAAAMYRSCSGPKYVCSAKYWNISRISWAPG